MRPGREADHSPPSSAEIKKAWTYTSTPLYVFLASYLIKLMDNLTFFTDFRLCKEVIISVEQNPSWEADSRSAAQGIPCG
jgi:hypothetical protein